MNNPNPQNYSYALDKDRNLLHVSKAVRGIEYYCPHCHALMIPHMGKIRRWHFTHKANIENCSYETYLHKIAKTRIRESFLNSSRFIISYDMVVKCDREDFCKNINSYQCRYDRRFEHDLKRFYDKCEEEVAYKNFVADLLISSSEKPEREPILVEIYVSHKSTREKTADGVRIIEVQIKNEEDIDRIVTSLRIDGDIASDMPYFRNERPKNMFFNFKETVRIESSYFIKREPVYFHFLWMEDSGYFKVDKCLCDDDPLIYIPENTYYVISSERLSLSDAFLELVKRGVEIKNCLVCKYNVETTMSLEVERICTLYKKYGTPRHPEINTAKTCSYFRKSIQTDDPKFHSDLIVGRKNVQDVL